MKHLDNIKVVVCHWDAKENTILIVEFCTILEGVGPNHSYWDVTEEIRKQRYAEIYIRNKGTSI